MPERAPTVDELRAELERALAELRAAEQQLLRASKTASLGEIVASVAHELNTPLGSIASNAQLAQKALAKVRALCTDAGLSDPRLDRALQALDQACQTELLASERALAIVKALRRVAGPDDAVRTSARLHEGIERTLAVLRHELAAIDIERDFGELPDVWCFPSQLEQVFMNLLLNAKQAMDGGGTITIETRVAGNEALLSFRDTGSGIAPDDLAHIFDTGFTTKVARGGSGLGLSISRQIVERHGGRLEVESQVGGGTTFTLRLPLGAAP